MLSDGTYDVFVVDATVTETPDAPRRVALELTITSGEHRGGVLEVIAVGLAGSEIDLLGMPGTLTITNGEPAFRLD